MSGPQNSRCPAELSRFSLNCVFSGLTYISSFSLQTLVLYALGVMLQDSSSWPSPYKYVESIPLFFSKQIPLPFFILVFFRSYFHAQPSLLQSLC